MCTIMDPCPNLTAWIMGNELRSKIQSCILNVYDNMQT